MYDDGKWTGWSLFKPAVNVKRGLIDKEKWDEAMDKATVIVNGKKIKDGVLNKGVTFVPLRAIGESTGAKIGWDNKSKTATLKRADWNVIL